jgi:alpha-mannosidase
MFKKISKCSIYLFFLISFVLIFTGFQSTSKKTEHYFPIPLADYYNRDGISWTKNPGDGNFDDRNCYPADELPEAGEVFSDSIPFLFPAKDDGKNNCLIPHKQKIMIPQGKYGALYVLGSSVNGPSSIEVTLNYKGGFEKELLYLSDWCHEPDFAEKSAIKVAYRLSPTGKASRSPSIWLQPLEVNPGLELESISLSHAENMRIFALTLGKELPDLTPEQIFSRLSYEDPGVKDYWLHFQSVKSVLHSLSLSNATLEEVEQIYHEALNSIDFSQSFENRKAFLSSIEKAKAKLNSAIRKAEKDLLENHALARDLDIFLLGQSHIDAAWLWRKYNTVEKCRFTFTQAIDHLKKHPAFLYAQSTPQFYLWTEDYFPELSKEIMSAYEAGRWEIVGGNWVEPDNNLPDGESLIRQRLYGQRYYLRRFGKISEIAWIPDSFGFNWNLPQILAKTGAKYFVTTKILWNDTNKFPFNVFIWQAPDGSQVLSYLGIRGYGNFPRPYLEDLKKFKKQNRLLKEQVVFDAKKDEAQVDNLFTDDYVKEIAYIYGAGDGGHGPTPKEVNSALVLSSLKPWKHEKMSNYFQELEKYRDKLPIWNDELYLEYHRGTYTSQADIKKLNRESEVLLLSGEKFSSLAALLGHHYHKNDLERAWRILLFNQFHDILPGSSIPEVYVDAKEDYDVLKKVGNFVLKNALNNLAQHINTQGEGQAAIVFNPLSWERKDIAKIEWVKESVAVYNSAGEEISSQVVEEDGKYFLIFPAEVPSLGYAVFRILPRSKNYEGQLKADSTSLENEYLKITINQMGWLSSVYDKRNNRELLAGEGNVLQAFTDKPKDWDAWNIATDYEKYPLAMPSPEIRVIESGPVRCRLRITRDFQNSTFIQDISLYQGMPLVEMRLKADWQETQTLLKVSFPVNVKAEKLVAEIPYAVYSRPTNPQSPMEKAKWEFSAQRWVDLSADGYGVSLLNRSKYGNDIKGNQLRLSLLKSAIWPDAKADRGKHTIYYALHPHQGDWKEATVYRRGQEYNYPLYSVLSPSHSGELPRQFSFFEVSPENVILYAVKKAEDNKGIILRIYETTGVPSKVEIKLPEQIAEAYEVDFLEMKKIAPIRNERQSITFDLGKFEIKTIFLNYN